MFRSNSSKPICKNNLNVNNFQENHTEFIKNNKLYKNITNIQK